MAISAISASILGYQEPQPEVLAAMVRKQLNLSLSLEQYKWLEELAQEAGETPTKYARHIVLDAISPAPETDLNSGVLVLPFWLAHFLLFLRTGRRGVASGH